MATSNIDNNDNDKSKKNKKRSLISQANEVEERLKIAKRKADFDRANCLTAQYAEDELTHQLLTKALREMFKKTDKLQGGSFIHGSMSTLSADMWKGVTDSSSSSRKK